MLLIDQVLVWTITILGIPAVGIVAYIIYLNLVEHRGEPGRRGRVALSIAMIVICVLFILASVVAIVRALFFHGSI